MKRDSFDGEGYGSLREVVATMTAMRELAIEGPVVKEKLTQLDKGIVPYLPTEALSGAFFFPFLPPIW